MSDDQDQFVSVDQIITKRAKTHSDVVLVTYPQVDGSYVHFTGDHLERATRALAIELAQALDDGVGTSLRAGLTRSPRGRDDMMVCMVGISDLSYYLTLLALQRLGVRTALISPRLSDVEFAHLLRATECRVVVASGASLSALARVRDGGVPVHVVEMVAAQDIKRLGNGEKVEMTPLDGSDIGQKPRLVLHSSGSTGVPKLVSVRAEQWQYKDWTTPTGSASTLSTISVLPLFHLFGLTCLFINLIHGSHLTFWGAERPVTTAALMRVMDHMNCGTMVAVPLILKYFAETPGGPERLGKLQAIHTAGAATPDHLGQKLVDAGAKLSIGYGLSEVGAVLRNNVKDEHYVRNWNWMSPIEAIEPFLQWEHVGDQLYHAVVKAGYPAINQPNRPDGSCATKDVFQRHPTDPRLWKWVSRLDDMIILVNGENVDPHPLEQALSSNANVRIAVMFGAGRDTLGVIVVRAERAATLAHADFVESLLPDLAKANALVPAFARVAPEGLLIKDAGTPVPSTDKHTVLRQKFLQLFEKDIEAHYATLEDAPRAKGRQNGRRPLSDMTDVELVDLVRDVVEHELRLKLADKGEVLDKDADFFNVGMDSLQAVNVRAALMRTLAVKLSTNVAFDHPTISLLSRHLLELGKGNDGLVVNGTERHKQEALAEDIVKKYSNFAEPASDCDTVETEDGFVVLLVGATGTIGPHVVATLLQRDRVRRVICLVRASSDDAARARVLDALSDARLLEMVPSACLAKLTAFASTISSATLGLEPATYQVLRETVTTIMHNAWSVNFNMSLASFEHSCIVGTHNLLNLALQSRLRVKPEFTFISSVAACALAPERPARETRHPFSAAIRSGYGQSKWVGEQLCFAASAGHGLRVRIMRVAQVAGDTAHGRWNPDEAVAAMVQTAVTVGALPVMDKGHNKQYWLPADLCGQYLVEAALLDAGLPDCAVFHVANLQPTLWNEEMLPALEARGLAFDRVSQAEWLRRLEASDPDVVRNPPVKLLHFFRAQYDSGADAAYTTGMVGDDPPLDMEQTVKYVPGLKDGMKLHEHLLGKFYEYWKETGWTRGSSRGEAKKTNGVEPGASSV